MSPMAGPEEPCIRAGGAMAGLEEPLAMAGPEEPPGQVGQWQGQRSHQGRWGNGRARGATSYGRARGATRAGGAMAGPEKPRGQVGQWPNYHLIFSYQHPQLELYGLKVYYNIILHCSVNTVQQFYMYSIHINFIFISPCMQHSFLTRTQKLSANLII
jgi:hypothetical protein